jgi:hypothetical protein
MIKISHDAKLFFDSVSFVPYHNIESRTYDMINQFFIENEKLFEKPPIVNYAIINKDDFGKNGKIGRIYMMSAVETDDTLMGVSVVITTDNTISSAEVSRLREAIKKGWARACVEHNFSMFESLHSMASLGVSWPEAKELLFGVCDKEGEMNE